MANSKSMRCGLSTCRHRGIIRDHIGGAVIFSLMVKISLGPRLNCFDELLRQGGSTPAKIGCSPLFPPAYLISFPPIIMPHISALFSPSCPGSATPVQSCHICTKLLDSHCNGITSPSSTTSSNSIFKATVLLHNQGVSNPCITKKKAWA